jgi:hypothetical protein
MTEKETEFSVKDKRRFDDQGEPKGEKDQTGEPAQAQAQEPKPTPEEAGSAEETAPPLPEMTFATLVFSLSSSALLHLGHAPHPESGEAKVDLPLAKQTIDLLALLQDKTKGNLDQDEDKLLEGVLYDLRMAYVRAVQEARRPSG